MPDSLVQGVHHLAINITDLEAACAFYGEAGLGLEELPRPSGMRSDGTWYQLGALQLHLQVKAPVPQNDAHFAVYVVDIEALKSKGLPVELANHTLGYTARGFVRDPSGNRIELLQP